MAGNGERPRGFISSTVHAFLVSRLSVILIIASLCLGIAALLVTPREEEPQIVVPLADIFVQAPGAGPEEIEKLVAAPLERLLWQIDGVEYVYSMSGRDMAVVTVRFFVGEDREDSLVKLHNKISMNLDIVPPLVKAWVIKPVEIDDVPIVTLVLHSDRYDDFELRRVGEEVLSRLSEVKNISRAFIVGGRQREIRVELDPERMTGMNVSLLEIHKILQGADSAVTAGTVSRFNKEFIVTSDSFLASREEVAGLLVGVNDGRPVYLRDVGTVSDGPREAESYSRIGYSDQYRHDRDMRDRPDSFSAVTLALAKKKGTNAVDVARDILLKIEELQGDIIPDNVEVEVTRNYGQTAQEKVNDLLRSLRDALVIVIILLVVALGWREATVVALSVPISFSLALFVNYLLGYSINRVTLFALILSLGLVVDDPIINVDNIQRHLSMGKRKSIDATLHAVNEVLPPVIMSTLTIIACFVPLFFITGMMGPYMAPMAANVPLTVIFSTVCALTIVPWLTHSLLTRKKPRPAKKAPRKPAGEPNRWISAIYRFIVTPFLDSRSKRYYLLAAVIVLLLVPLLLVVFRFVPLKLLPFDNKNEFQLVVDMEEGGTLESTDSVVREFEKYLRAVPEVTAFVSYVGTSSPMDFNGMVRHYFLRRGSNLADIRVNLADKSDRKMQSHSITLRLRDGLREIADAHGARLKIVETPPGPPVLSTIVAEIYGASDMPYAAFLQAAKQIRELFASEPFVVDIDDVSETERDRIDFVLDKEKAALHGVDADSIIQTLRIAIGGSTPASVHAAHERQPLMIRIILPREERSSITSLSQIPIKTGSGMVMPLAELVTIHSAPVEQTIYHKNLERVMYVSAEMAGRSPAEAILDMQGRMDEMKLLPGMRVEWAGEGEWKITLQVFRDMGIAFAAAMLGIYILLIIQTNSYLMPLLIMTAIPLTLIGVMPGFFFLNLIAGGQVGGYYDPVFFTATSMIGMIALGGIVIRNSVVLIEFIQDALHTGMPFREAVLQSGAIRMRPILLTAATTALSAYPITLDPVFSGLAWCLIFGLLASTVFTLVVIPVTYYALHNKKHAA